MNLTPISFRSCSTGVGDKYLPLQYGMIYIWRPLKLSNFEDPYLPCSSTIYVQNSSIPLTMDVQFQTNPPPPISFQKITSQLKQNNPSKGDYYMLSGPSFRSAFVVSINSLVLSSFPWTLSFSWNFFICFFMILYSDVCSCPEISGNIFYL